MSAPPCLDYYSPRQSDREGQRERGWRKDFLQPPVQSAALTAASYQMQGELGNFVVTNLRLIWYSEINPQFNVSCPYNMIVSHRRCSCQSKGPPVLLPSLLACILFSFISVITCLLPSIPLSLFSSLACLQASVNTRNSKFGKALVLKLCALAGGLNLGFRCDPEAKVRARWL